MSERSFRLLIGVWLVVMLMMNQPLGLYVLTAVLVFEGLTNWRIPTLISRYCHGEDQPREDTDCTCSSPFEAERALRVIIALLLVLSLLSTAWLWWLPWMLGFALIGAGLSGICPMVMALRWIGMR